MKWDKQCHVSFSTCEIDPDYIIANYLEEDIGIPNWFERTLFRKKPIRKKRSEKFRRRKTGEGRCPWYTFPGFTVLPYSLIFDTWVEVRYKEYLEREKYILKAQNKC